MTTIQTNNVSFRAGYLNILAAADQHGKITELPKVMKTVDNNASKIFLNAGSQSTLNIFAVVGDWFINPSKRGFLTNPNASNGDLQYWAFSKTIEKVKEMVKNQALRLSNSLQYRFDTLYTLGNHCLDAGADFAINAMKNLPMKSLITNVDLNSPDSYKIKKAAIDSNQILKSVEYSIPDDKNKNLIHKILVLGATIPSMGYYNPGLCEGLKFYDDSERKDSALTTETLQGTINSIKEQIEEFKSKNPNGAVILLSHMGERIADIIIKSVSGIDQILNGHDHETSDKIIDGTSISSLGKDNEIIKSLNFKFDDEGHFLKPIINQYNIRNTLLDGLENTEFQKSLLEKLSKDLEPVVKVNDLAGFGDEKTGNRAKKTSLPEADIDLLEDALKTLGITDKKAIKNFYDTFLLKNTNLVQTELCYGDEIRFQNSYLMNFLTSAIKEQIVKTIDKDVFTVGLQSSIVRGGIKDGANNLDVMKVFDGVSEELSGLKAGYVSGKNLAGLVIENVLDNLVNRKRNTLIHWSDIQINRSMIEGIKNGVIRGNYEDAVLVRNPKTAKFEPIDLNKDYKVVIGKKYLMKNSIKYPPLIRDDFKPLGVTYDKVFRDYLTANNFNINITNKTKENRVI